MDEIAIKNLAILKLLEEHDGGILVEYFTELIQAIEECQCGLFETDSEEEDISEKEDTVKVEIDDKGFHSLV
jgi:hypothetical protein